MLSVFKFFCRKKIFADQKSEDQEKKMIKQLERDGLYESARKLRKVTYGPPPGFENKFSKEKPPKLVRRRSFAQFEIDRKSLPVTPTLSVPPLSPPVIISKDEVVSIRGLLL